MKLAPVILNIILVICGLSVADCFKSELSFEESALRDSRGMENSHPRRGSPPYSIMPPSKNLTQIERLNWAENCRQFRQKCKFSEQCCSNRCLKHIKRCTTL